MRIVYRNNAPNGYTGDIDFLNFSLTASGGRVNVALTANGSTASASSLYTQCCGFTAAAATDGDRKGLNYMGGGIWHSGANTFPQWLQVDFNGSKTIDEVNVDSTQDNYTNPVEPTEAMTFSLYGLTGFDIQIGTDRNLSHRSGWECVRQQQSLEESCLFTNHDHEDSRADQCDSG